MGSVDLIYQAQKALVIYLKANLNAARFPTIVKATERPLQAQGEEVPRILPAVIVWSKTAEPYAKPSGNRKVLVTVEVRAHSKDTTDEQFHTLTDEAFSVVQVSDLASQLSTVLSDFTVFLAVTQPLEFTIEQQHWVSRWNAE